jgi:hypothetical protein
MEQRRKLLDGLEANENDISLDIFEDFYPDQAHFVFELLQNAEDTGATEAGFTLTDDGCWFEHNGKRAFSEADVRAITGIHNSTKTKSAEQIGKFGVGFKSVFVYTQTPTIYAADFSFKITKYVMPEPVAGDAAIGMRTKFWLPFDNPKKPAEMARAEVAAGLNELAENALLFLPNIESIRWRIGDAHAGEILRIEHAPVHVEVMKQVNGQPTTSAHFLKFDQVVAGLEKQHVAIAFSLDFLPNVQAFSDAKPLSQQLKIVGVPGQVAVFFPAHKEISGLRFHLHAPFVPELSRASIKATPANHPLFQQLAALAVSALHEIRDLGLLTTDFLGVLPSPKDVLGEDSGYTLIRDAIIEAMKKEPLFPTHAKAHAPAKTLVQAKASLKSLLSDGDIGFLIKYEDDPPLWAANRAKEGTTTERFMTGLEIPDWDIAEFVECIKEKTSEGWPGVNAEFIAWLGRKSIEWHQELYALLDQESDAKSNGLRCCRIIRLPDGAYATGPACHFPEEKSSETVGVQCVDRAVYTAGKSKGQQESARKFLESAGVTSVGERQLVEALLNNKYNGEQRPLAEREYPADLRRFMKILDEDATAAKLLSSYPLFVGQDNKWHKASEIYLDRPYMDTGLSEYAGLVGASYKRTALATFYKSLPIDIVKIATFAAKLGADTILEISRTNCRNNPEWLHLRANPGARFGYNIDKDYVINQFEALVRRMSVPLARLVWNTMCTLPKSDNGYDSRYSGNPLAAQYRVNRRDELRSAGSQLVHLLRGHAWVPQGKSFARPADARAELLPSGFTFDPGWPWLKAIQFGRNIHLRDQKAQEEAAASVERKRKEQEAAEALGFEDADTARKFAAMPVEEQNRALAEWERRKNVALPDQDPSDRRRERIIAHSATAPQRQTEPRTRSVAVNREEIKEEAKQYLQQRYTNEDAEQICQICKDVLPFRLSDESFYFEAVELLPELSRHYDQNYLCLCPNHAAMFKHANGSRDTLKDRLRHHTENELNVVLAGRDEVVYFNRVHLADLRAIIDADEDSEDDEYAESASVLLQHP